MQPTFDFLSNGGEMGALMRARNWAATPLGPVQTWPDTLKTTVRLILTSSHPMFIWWGTDLIQFYNDGYRQTMGPERHPSALGQPGGECWAEIWPIIGPQIERVMAGKGATWNEEQLVPVTRHGRRQDVWWTYGYSPIESTDGVQGVLVVCNDVTEQHNAKEELIRLNRQLSEQIARRVQSEQHQAFQLELVDRLRGCTQSQEIAATAFALLGRHLQVSHVHYAEINEASGTFQIAHAWSRDDSSRIAGTSGVLDDFGPAIIAALRSGQIVPVSDILTDPRTAPYAHTYSALGSRAVVVVPIIKTGRFVATISLQQATSYEWTADQIALVEDVAERIWNAIAHARADEQHRADERAALRQRDAENERLRVLFRQAPGFMCILRGANHIFEFTNAAYMRLVGSERQLIGKPIREAFPELAGQGFFALLDQVFTTAKPFSASGMSLVLQPHPDAPALQTYVDFVYQPIIDENGAVSAIFVEGFDATEHYLAKAALQDSEARLKEGLRVARMVVWDWDLATERGKFSDNASAVFGADWAGITSLWESIHADDRQRLQHAHSVALEQCADYQELVRLIRPDNGALLWLQMHGQVVCGENGAPQAMRGIAIDVTERKSGEEALRDADRRKDEFLAMLAHELRNPLAPISAAAQLLSFVSHDAARVRQASEIITRQADHMANLISDLLDVSRVTTGLIELDRQPLDIKQIALESVEQARPLIEARRHHFTLHACSDAAIVLGDRKRLVQVMTNLLQNAAKYTPEGGNIALSIATRADEVVISVQDDGLGMDAQLLPHVFELFSQAKRSSDRSQGGLGLGLALVKSLVALHGGRVIAASDGNGKGSIFALFFPQFSAPSAIEPDLAATTVRTAVFKPLRLLVVDDNADAANVLAMFLRAVGHQVLVEYEPEAALACAQREAPDVCLLDIGLPGMGGNELARRLRAMPQTARATLIAVTGYGQEYDKCTSIVAGFDHYFVKPVDTARLLERLAEIDPA